MSKPLEKFLSFNVINVNNSSSEHRRRIGVHWFLTWIHKEEPSQETLESVATKLSKYKNICNFIIQMEKCPLTSKSHIHMAITLDNTSHRPVPFFDKTFPGVHIQYVQNVEAVRLYCCKPYTRQLDPLFFNKSGLSSDKCLDRDKYLKMAEELSDEAKCNIDENSLKFKIIKAREKQIEKIQIKMAIADITEESKNYISEKKKYTKLIVDLETKLEIEPGKKGRLKGVDRAFALTQKSNYEKSLSQLEFNSFTSSVNCNTSDEVKELKDKVITLEERIIKLEKIIATLNLSTILSPIAPPKFEDIEFEPNSPTPPELEHRNLSPKSLGVLANQKYKQARDKGVSHADAVKIMSATRNGTAIPSFPPIKVVVNRKKSESKGSESD
jgi:hypothetical protein